ncbi:unnamed protein product [Penicillium salamii]|nr:unnamed protein product [Penicillium salamii]
MTQNSFVSRGPRSYPNEGFQSNGNGNGNGNRNGNRNFRNQNRNDNQNYNRGNQNHYDNHGNGNYGNVNPNPNYKGKNFNPNYCGRNFNPDYQGPRGGSVGDARGSPESQLNGQGPFTGARNNRRNRNRNRNNRNNQSLPDNFRAQADDIDMSEAPPVFAPPLFDDSRHIAEPIDTEMPDAPPLFDNIKIELFNAGAAAVQEAVGTPTTSFFQSFSFVSA